MDPDQLKTVILNSLGSAWQGLKLHISGGSRVGSGGFSPHPHFLISYENEIIWPQ